MPKKVAEQEQQQQQQQQHVGVAALRHRVATGLPPGIDSLHKENCQRIKPEKPCARIRVLYLFGTLDAILADRPLMRWRVSCLVVDFCRFE